MTVIELRGIKTRMTRQDLFQDGFAVLSMSVVGIDSNNEIMSSLLPLAVLKADEWYLEFLARYIQCLVRRLQMPTQSDHLRREE
jgi:hypothetical protein